MLGCLAQREARRLTLSLEALVVALGLERCALVRILRDLERAGLAGLLRR